MFNFLNRVIVIPEKLQSALYGALLYYAVLAEVGLAALAEKYLGIVVDFSGVVAPLAAVLALVVVALAKRGLEALVPEKYHELVNSFLVWVAGFFGALTLIHNLK